MRDKENKKKNVRISGVGFGCLRAERGEERGYRESERDGERGST